MSRTLTRLEKGKIYWGTLALMLPPEGIESKYPTEEASRARLSEYRWPDRPQCPRCLGSDLNWLDNRDEFVCRRCRKHTSVTSGTFLHGTKVTILQWFTGAERIIQDRFSSPEGWHITAQEFSSFLGVSYRTGFKMRRTLLNDLKDGGPGFFRSLICEKGVELPDHVTLNSRDHLSWLNLSLRKESGQDLEELLINRLGYAKIMARRSRKT